MGAVIDLLSIAFHCFPLLSSKPGSTCFLLSMLSGGLRPGKQKAEAAPQTEAPELGTLP
jgi:hypothetical protein